MTITATSQLIDLFSAREGALHDAGVIETSVGRIQRQQLRLTAKQASWLLDLYRRECGGQQPPSRGGYRTAEGVCSRGGWVAREIKGGAAGVIINQC